MLGLDLRLLLCARGGGIGLGALDELGGVLLGKHPLLDEAVDQVQGDDLGGRGSCGRPGCRNRQDIVGREGIRGRQFADRRHEFGSRLFLRRGKRMEATQQGEHGGEPAEEMMIELKHDGGGGISLPCGR